MSDKVSYVFAWSPRQGESPPFLKIVFQASATSESEAKEIIRQRLFKDPYERPSAAGSCSIVWDERMLVKLDFNQEFFNELTCEQTLPGTYAKDFNVLIAALDPEAKFEDDTLERLKNLQEKTRAAHQTEVPELVSDTGIGD